MPKRVVKNNNLKLINKRPELKRFYFKAVTNPEKRASCTHTENLVSCEKYLLPKSSQKKLFLLGYMPRDKQVKVFLLKLRKGDNFTLTLKFMIAISEFFPLDTCPEQMKIQVIKPLTTSDYTELNPKLKSSSCPLYPSHLFRGLVAEVF